MSSAAQFPNRFCPRGNRLHRTESLRHSDSETSPLSHDQDESPASASIPDHPPSQTPVAASVGPGRTPLEAQDDGAHHAPDPPDSDDGPDESDGGYTIQVDRTPPPPGSQPRTVEEVRLRNSLAALQDNLNTSTALVNNLRARDAFHRHDRTAKKAEWKRICQRRDEAMGKARRAVQRERRMKLALAVLLGLVLVGCVGLGFVAWVQGPEREYVRRRREEILWQ
ncbi:unnamed protein product [Zymoseptoria tritici ST99CH_3D1]|uniref:Uncharacterized protein n=1 Tax=Zymoseptoria tritici (strain ST99CH_3D7) TaxID=1276538 RepID=A0A1X7RNR4_ZYMT9|nr:unnamed protein product [Zymoseptoria tritici ST99CH_3D7]SMR49635.1 unnamed protein product [Zymoseptoria tritici ST99CH_3D1]